MTVFATQRVENKPQGLMDPKTPEAHERHKAFVAGKYFMAFAAVALAATVVAFIVQFATTTATQSGFSSFISIFAGLVVASVIVGAMLIFDSGRQRKRDPRRRPPGATTGG